jgi:hypothetical protein
MAIGLFDATAVQHPGRRPRSIMAAPATALSSTGRFSTSTPWALATLLIASPWAR